jgi:hypothetical protein
MLSSANPVLKFDIVWEMSTKMFRDANHTNDKHVKKIHAYEN